MSNHNQFDPLQGDLENSKMTQKKNGWLYDMQIKKIYM